MPNLVGTGLNQVPINGMLGGLAYQDPEHASIKNLDLKNLSQINSEIADTAVDVFVYDTRKDSDGGAWRKRTQNTSWYNETLNTSTRGSRKEFPAVAVIVCGTDGSNGLVHIYDGDDPDLPMWMTFNANAAALYTTPNAVVAMNGMIFVGTPTYGLPRYDFIGDTIGRYRAGAYQGYKSPDRSIGGRDTATSSFIDGPPFNNPLINDSVHDVAMTVLPNAPIDDATGLPVPTIAVGTEGGLSVITDSGSVFDDVTSAGMVAGVESCAFSGTKIVCCRGGASGNKVYVQDASTISADFTSERMYRVSQYGETNEVQHVCHNLADIDEVEGSDDNLILGAEEGIAIINENLESPTNGLVAKIRADYNTGWMHGNNKGAFLSDTDTTNLSGYLYEDTMQSDNTSNWTDDYADTFEHITSPLIAYRLVRSTNDARVQKDLAGTISQGTKIIVTYEATSSSGSKTIKYGMTNGAYDQSQISSVTVDTYWNQISFEATFGVTGSSGHTFVTLWNSSTGEVRYRNFRVRVVEEDRSVNNKSLAYFGTVTKTPVATGADLVAYSGFSNSDYLEQPNNTDYSFGTGDFYVMTWVYPLGTSAQYDFMLELNDASTVNRFYLLRSPNGRVYVPWNIDVAGSDLPLNQWSCVIAQRKSGIGEVYVNGVFKVSNAWTSNNNLTQTGGTFIGIYPGGGVGPNSPAFPLDGKLSLMRIGAGAISAEQIKKMYEDEKVLFQENAKATLYGSSNSVTALAFDDTTNLLHVGTSAGRSDFQGLRRITNTTDAVTTAISARNSLIIEQ